MPDRTTFCACVCHLHGLPPPSGCEACYSLHPMKLDLCSPPRSTAALVDERAKTHGSFAGNSEAFAALVEAVPLESFDRRTRYAVAMTYVKLARMSSGQSTSRQHIEDISGYSELLLKEIDEGRL